MGRWRSAAGCLPRRRPRGRPRRPARAARGGPGHCRGGRSGHGRRCPRPHSRRDVRLPDGSGVEICREIRATMPETACVMLTSYADDEALIASIMAGAAGYVLKQVGSLDLIDTIRRVGAGQSLLDPSFTERVLDRLREGPKLDPRLASLTPQERRILDLIAEGYTNRQIADTMFLAEKTVKNYVSNLLGKLGMERRTQAATFAARLRERSTQESRSEATGT